MVMTRKIFFDLNDQLDFSHVFERLQKGVTNVFRKNGICSSYGISPNIRISKMCSTISWQLQSQRFFMLGSISLHGFCPTHLSFKSPRYRDLFTIDEKQTLPHGHSFSDCPRHFVKRKQHTGLAQVLIHSARDLYINDDFGVDLANTVYALDATTIDLCLSVFPWARFRKTKAGIKLHTLLDLRGNIPTFIEITEALLHDVNIPDVLVAEPGACYIMDRGYLDFARLYRWTLSGIFFIIRSKRNFKFRRLYSHKVDTSTGLRFDQTIVLTNSFKDYPEKLRRVGFFDAKNNKLLIFLTNDFSLPALTIARLYKCRWQVELFFKWIKQHLRVKSFFGTSENAVKTQIWIAISVYVLVAIIKKRLNIQHSLYAILQVLSVTVFEKASVLELLTSIEKFDPIDEEDQLMLFND